MDRIKERCKVEREVLFYGDDGRVVAKETKYRGNDGLARFTVEYRVGGEWTYHADEAPAGVVAMVRKYEDRRRTSHTGVDASFTTKDVGAILETAAKERLAISIGITPLDRPGEDANAATIQGV